MGAPYPAQFPQTAGYPPMISPAPTKKHTGWIVSGIAAVVVIVAVIIVLVFTLLRDSGPDMTDPKNWRTNADMAEGIRATGARCDEFGKPNESTSTCTNDTGTSYLVGYGPTASRDARIASVFADATGNRAVAWEDNWAVVCIGINAMTDCQEFSDAFGSPNEAVDVSKDRPSDSGSSSSDGSLSTSAGPVDSFGDGTHIVGEDIEPGTYRNSGNSSCYWARLSGFSGTTDSILANDNTRDQAIVTIESSDRAFQAKRCGTWTKID